MKHSLIIGQRVLRELSKDKRLFGLSIFGPFILIYLLKIFIDSMPPHFPAARYAMPFAAYIVHFFSFMFLIFAFFRSSANKFMSFVFPLTTI